MERAMSEIHFSEIYSYVNKTPNYQVLSISDHRFPLEKVVLPNECITFACIPSVIVKICTAVRIDAIYCDEILCKFLTQGDE
jgi:hypothetical protein